MGLRVVTRRKKAAVKCHFELKTLLHPYKGDKEVMVKSSERFELNWSDGFTVDGMGRLIALMREELSDVLGPITASPWSDGMTITRTFNTREEYDQACSRIADFVRMHNYA